MFRGEKPAAQPRSLRSIAESKGTTPSGFHEDLPYDTNAGIPQGAVHAQGQYEDAANEAKPDASQGKRQTSPADKSPFK